MLATQYHFFLSDFSLKNQYLTSLQRTLIDRLEVAEDLYSFSDFHVWYIQILAFKVVYNDKIRPSKLAIQSSRSLFSSDPNLSEHNHLIDSSKTKLKLVGSQIL